MPYALRIDGRALDYLNTLDARPFRQIVRRLLDLSENTRPHDSEELKAYRDSKVPGRKGYRLDRGEYRLLYTIDEHAHCVIVFRAGHRRDVYR